MNPALQHPKASNLPKFPFVGLGCIKFFDMADAVSGHSSEFCVFVRKRKASSMQTDVPNAE